MLNQWKFVACLTMAVALCLASANARNNALSNRSKNNDQLTKMEQRFLAEVIQGDLAEVNAGKLAQEKGQADDVKQFGQMLQQDHGEHLKKAEQLAQQLGVTPPTSPNATQQATNTKLERLSGAAFDKEFKQTMVKDHNEDIAKYRREAGLKGALGKFAQETIPTLEKHLKHAHALGRQAPTTGRGTKH